MPIEAGFASFRRRLTRSYVLLVTALIVVVAATTTILAFASYIGNVQDAMAQAQRHVNDSVSANAAAHLTFAQAGPKIVAAAGRGPIHVIAVGANRTIVAGASQERSAGDRIVDAIASAFGLHSVHVRADGGTISIAPDIGRFGGFIMWYWSIVLPVGGIAIIFAWLIGRAITQRAIAPLDDVKAALDRIADGNFEPEPLARDSGELAALTSSYNGVARRLTAASNERRQNELRMRQFISDAGHELRTPLTVVMGYLDVLADGIVRDPEGIAKIQATMQEESRRMRALIDRLIYLARLEQSEAPRAEPFDLATQVREVVKTLEPIAAGRIQARVADSAIVRGDALEMREAVKNTVENALKYAPSSPVGITVVNEGGTATITIVDRGPGMNERDREHAFDRFYRGAARDGVEGTGLGLAIAQRAVERAGGTIALASVPGDGTTVTFSLPAVAVEAAKTALPVP